MKSQKQNVEKKVFWPSEESIQLTGFELLSRSQQISRHFNPFSNSILHTGTAFIQRGRMVDTVDAKCSCTFCLPFEAVPLKKAITVLLMVMEEVWRILPPPQDSLSKRHIISVRDSPTVEMAPIILNSYEIVLSEVNPLFY